MSSLLTSCSAFASLILNICTVRSILAQTYLEIMQLFGAITSPSLGNWLFKRVDSAGIDIRARHVSFGMSIIQKGVDKLISAYDPGTFTELSRVGELLKSQGSFPLTGNDLMTYQYVLSFEPYTFLINKLREDIGKQNPNVALAQIVTLEGCNDISTVNCMQDEQNIDKLIKSIKAAVKQFVAQPPFNCSTWMYTAVNYRVAQLITNDSSLKYLTPGSKEPLQESQKLREIENKTGCSVKITRRRGVQDGVLVSIIGPPERLKEASSLTVRS